MVAPLDLTSAARLLARAGEGTEDVLGALAGEPVLVVDLDRAETPEELRTPPLLPAVVVGTTATGKSGHGCDVVLTESPSPPRPLVSVPDLAAAVDLLVGQARATPAASVTLVQILRAGRADSLEHDLLLESLAYSTLQSGPGFAQWKKDFEPRRRPPETALPLTAERSGDSLLITLNRPHVRNAFNAAMRDALAEVLSLACADPEIAEVHLWGAGPSFCSGGDLAEFGTRPDPATAHLIRVGRSPARLLSLVASRVTAHLHGWCVGAGIELPALAGRIVAAADTQIRLPELAMGLVPGAGGTATLPRRIGRERTAWLALSGQVLDSGTALAWGLIDEIARGEPL